MVHRKLSIYPAESLIFALLLFTACTTTQKLKQHPIDFSAPQVSDKKISGGSSGMEQLTDSTYLVVYDLKKHKSGTRLGWIILTHESINVLPIEMVSWGEEGNPNDLESICLIPGKTNEFLVAEAGNWQGALGRIFHIKIDFSLRIATVLGSVKYPFLHLNDFDIEGDQYEAMHCLPYTENERIILLGERGGSEFSPLGIIRWGLWDMKQNTLTIEGDGLKGIPVDAPGQWTNAKTKRCITDIHVDHDGILWASASEDQGDSGPFYSVIYALGHINPMNFNQPVAIFDTLTMGREIHGLKIEALSGPKKGISCTHAFGTEDEIYGGVWRPINIAPID